MKYVFQNFDTPFMSCVVQRCMHDFGDLFQYLDAFWSDIFVDYFLNLGLRINN